MSKSYNNTISPFEEEKEIKKQVMRIVTDSTPVDQPKNPDKCNVFALYKLMATEEEIETMRNKYLNGGFGYGEAKKILLEKILDYFSEIRKKYFEFKKDPSFVLEVFKKRCRKSK
jgi:tryptophanyl-tRNA synthetase